MNQLPNDSPFVGRLNTVSRTLGRSTAWTLIGLVFATGSALGQTVVSLDPSKDGSLFEEGDLSNGGGAYLFTGTTLMGARRRALIQFDFSVIPSGATIDEVRLELAMSRTISGTLSVRLHRVLGDWGEGAVDAPLQEGTGAPAAAGDATWTHRRFNSVLWTDLGGDYDPRVSATAPVRDFGVYLWSAPQMVADVQDWLENGNSNFGWIVIGNEAAGFATAKRFDSRENPNATARPGLMVTYTGGTPAPSPPQMIPTLNWASLTLLSILMLALASRRNRIAAKSESRSSH